MIISGQVLGMALTQNERFLIFGASKCLRIWDFDKDKYHFMKNDAHDSKIFEKIGSKYPRIDHLCPVKSGRQHLCYGFKR